MFTKESLKLTYKIIKAVVLPGEDTVYKVEVFDNAKGPFDGTKPLYINTVLKTEMDLIFQLQKLFGKSIFEVENVSFGIEASPELEKLLVLIELYGEEKYSSGLESLSE